MQINNLFPVKHEDDYVNRDIATVFSRLFKNLPLSGISIDQVVDDPSFLRASTRAKVSDTSFLLSLQISVAIYKWVQAQRLIYVLTPSVVQAAVHTLMHEVRVKDLFTNQELVGYVYSEGLDFESEGFLFNFCDNKLFISEVSKTGEETFAYTVSKSDLTLQTYLEHTRLADIRRSYLRYHLAAMVIIFFEARCSFAMHQTVPLSKLKGSARTAHVVNLDLAQTPRIPLTQEEEEKLDNEIFSLGDELDLIYDYLSNCPIPHLAVAARALGRYSSAPEIYTRLFPLLEHPCVFVAVAVLEGLAGHITVPEVQEKVMQITRSANRDLERKAKEILSAI